jgi:hypothetical protein
MQERIETAKKFHRFTDWLTFSEMHIAKQNRSLTDYKWLCQVDKSKGLDIGNTYQTEHSARDFIGCIAKYERVFNYDVEYVVAF